MATVGITFGNPVFRLYPVVPRASEAVTSSGSSAATTAATQPGETITIATTGDIWVTFAASPTAAAGTTYLVTAGGKIDLVDMVGGNKVAVIDA